MKKLIAIILSGLFISIFYYFFINQYLILAFDTFMDFTDRTYISRLWDEYKTKDYNFLIREIKYNRINFTRFGAAVSSLFKRHEKRAIDDISKAFLDMRRDSQIRQDAAMALAEFGGEKATSTLLSVANKYKYKKFDLSNKSDSKEFEQYFKALQALSIMQNEDIYLLLLKYAKEGNKFEKGYTISSCLYNYKIRWQETLPIYLEKLKADPSSGIDYLKKIGRPEAIPALRNIVETDKDPFHRREAEEAIKYLESSKVSIFRKGNL